MHIINSITLACEKFITEKVPSDMKREGSIIVEFSRIHEVMAALEHAGFELERDFVVLP